jgi:hypothetical protein
MQDEGGGLHLETLTCERLVHHVADPPALSKLWVTGQRSPAPLIAFPTQRMRGVRVAVVPSAYTIGDVGPLRHLFSPRTSRYSSLAVDHFMADIGLFLLVPPVSKGNLTTITPDEDPIHPRHAFLACLACLARHAVTLDYNPTNVLISARNASRCSPAQASRRGNR